MRPMQHSCLDSVALLYAIMSLVLFVRLLHESSTAISKSLPRFPVELSQLELAAPDADLESPLGGILAPTTPTSSNISPFTTPSCARFGSDLSFDLVLALDNPQEAIGILLTALSGHVGVEAVYKRADPATGAYSSSELLEFACTPCPAERKVRVSLRVPDDDRVDAGAPVCSAAHLPPVISLLWVSIGGERLLPVASLDVADSGEGDASVLHIPVGRGIVAPQALTWDGYPTEFNTLTTPAVTQEGTLYLALHASKSVFSFAFNGQRLPNLLCEDIGISQYASVAAFHDDTGTLFIADWINAPYTRLIAIDVATGRQRWESREGALNRCRGVAVLGGPGVVAASSHEGYTIQLFSIADGSIVGAHEFDRSSFGRVECLASDPGSVRLFASVGGKVMQLEWTGSKLVRRCLIDAVNITTSNDRPMAVVPSRSRSSPAHLVVATEGKPELIVLSLPDCAVVRKHTLQSRRIKGLTADPSGASLIVCFNQGVSEIAGPRAGVLVLPWPLTPTTPAPA
jgi:hypothetical protein